MQKNVIAKAGETRGSRTALFYLKIGLDIGRIFSFGLPIGCTHPNLHGKNCWLV